MNRWLITIIIPAFFIAVVMILPNRRTTKKVNLNEEKKIVQIGNPEVIITETPIIVPTVIPTPTVPVSPWPVHRNIRATVFWVGESASEDNGYIPNLSSSWDKDWLTHFGGIDTPYARNGFYPRDFIPGENPFYVALPYIEYEESELKSNTRQVYWVNQISPAQPLLKNRWVRVKYYGNTCYGQWEDVGPFETDDVNYVFGSDRPIYEEAGIDLSPAVRTCLGMPMADVVSWQFVTEEMVPPGPWKETITSSGVNW
jgi:hypothetical protein